MSEAGGLGLIGAANAPAEWVREEIRKAKELTDKPFGVNIMLMSPYADDVAKVVAEEGVKVVTTGAGNPGKYPGFLEGSRHLRDPGSSFRGPCQNDGAGRSGRRGGGRNRVGGHIGETTTMVLVPQVVDAVKIPVIAAGGIADGRGIAAAFMLGAKGVQLGTRFVASKEAVVHQNYKDYIVKAKDIDTRVTGRSTGHPVRVLRNAVTKEYLELEKKGASFEELESLTVGGLRRAVQEGDTKTGSLMSGQIAGMIRDIPTCQEIIDRLVTETDKLMKGTGIYE